MRVFGGVTHRQTQEHEDSQRGKRSGGRLGGNHSLYSSPRVSLGRRKTSFMKFTTAIFHWNEGRPTHRWGRRGAGKKQGKEDEMILRQ